MVVSYSAVARNRRRFLPALYSGFGFSRSSQEPHLPQQMNLAAIQLLRRTRTAIP
jgi:hypothetical protein